MRKKTYIIIDSSLESAAQMQSVLSNMPNLDYIISATTYDLGVDMILQYNPDIVFLQISADCSKSKISLHLISDLYRYLKKIPKVIVTADSMDFAFEVIKYDAFDYLVKPLTIPNVRKTLMRLDVATDSVDYGIYGIGGRQDATNQVFVEKRAFDEAVSEMPVTEAYEFKQPEKEIVDESGSGNGIVEVSGELQPASSSLEPIVEKPLIICVKSYGDYRFIEASDICYLQADNNSTDIHLHNGEMITAFKTLKHFESILKSPFMRIHNSYIVNIDFVSRIHTGNSVCYIKNSSIKLPFSKTYKENIDAIISNITNGNYLEI